MRDPEPHRTSDRRRPAREAARLSLEPRRARPERSSRRIPARRRCRLLLDRDFAVILLDVNMPGMDGFETAELIRQRRRSRTRRSSSSRPSPTRCRPRRLRAGRRRLHPHADRAGDPARQGQGVRRAGADALRACPVARPAGAAGGGAHRRACAVGAAARRGGDRAQAGGGAPDDTGARAEPPGQEHARRAAVDRRAHSDLSRSVEEASEILAGRLQALGRAHELLVEASWSGAPLEDIVEAELAGFSERVRAAGPEVLLSASAVQTFALIMHELSTNASKYGALSNADGEVDVKWGIESDGQAKFLASHWKEKGGPPVVDSDVKKGFGFALIHAMGRSLTSAPASTCAPRASSATSGCRSRRSRRMRRAWKARSTTCARRATGPSAPRTCRNRSRETLLTFCRP